jgi:DNA-binding NarL/FixJ family response regulator
MGDKNKNKNIGVLICDDNLTVRASLSRALSFKKGVEVLAEISSFDEMEPALEKYQPAVVLLDVNMPGISGIDGLKKLRQAGIDVPVIIMSADQRNREPALEAGVSSFFYKGSTNITELVDDIKAAVGAK